MQNDGDGVHGALPRWRQSLGSSTILAREWEAIACANGALGRRGAHMGRVLLVVRDGYREHARDEDGTPPRVS